MNPNINKMAAALLLMAAAATSLSAQTLVPRQDPKKATWGYAVESSEKWSVKPQYETAEAFSQKPNGKSRAFVSKNGKKGLLDENGKVLGAGIVFEEIVPMQGDAMMVTVKGKKGVANYDGVYLVKPEIETVEPLGNEGFIVTVKGKKGLLAHDGSYILNPIYKDINTSLPDYFIANKDGKATLLSRDGKTTLIEPKEYTGIEHFGELWKVYKGDKVGLVGLKKPYLFVKSEYTDVKAPVLLKGETFIPVEKGAGKWGLLSNYGQTVVKHDYTDIVPAISLGAILLYKNKEVKGIYFAGDKKPYKVAGYREDTSGPFRIRSFRYGKNKYVSQLIMPDGTTCYGEKSDIKNVGGEYLYVDVPGTITPLWDRQGKMVVPGMSGKPKMYADWVLTNNKAISPDRKVFDYEWMNDYPVITDGDGRKSLIFNDGRLSDFTFDSFRVISINTPRVMKIKKEGYLAVKNGDMVGLYDENDVILPLEYGDIDLLQPDKALFKIARDGKYGIYDLEEKKEVISPSFEKFSPVEDKESLYHIEQNGKKGLYDSESNCIVIDPSKGYDDFVFVNYLGRKSYSLSMGGFVVTKNDKKGFVARVDGEIKEVIAPTYDEITNDGVYLWLRKGSSKSAFNAENQAFINGVNCNAEYVQLQGGPGLDINRIWGYAPNASTVKIVVTAYNANGTVYKDSYGDKLVFSEEIGTNNGIFSYRDRILFEYRAFPRYQKKNFYFKVSLYDQNGKAIPFKGKDKFSFWVSRY